MSKSFHLGDILSITTGRLVSPEGIDGVYEILNFMTNDNLYTHQLPRAGEECKPYLLEQFPQLAEITGEDVTPDNWQEWIADKCATYGTYHGVITIHGEDHEVIDPHQELVDMVGEERVIVARIDEDTDNGTNER